MTLPAPGLIRAANVAMNHMADRNTPFVKNEWYVVAFVSELQHSLLKRTVLGQRIVLFRTLDGKPVALDDRCPHRSYPLSAGILDGDTIICGYHGLRYDKAGDCIEVPSQKICPKGIGVRAFPLVERGPFVWGWLGDAPPDPARIPATPWLEGNQWTSSQGYFHLASNYVSLHENLLDLTHLSFVHAGSFGTPQYASSPYELKLEEGYYQITRSVVPTQLPPVWAVPTKLEHDHSARIATSEFVSPALHVVSVKFYDCNLPEGQRPEYIIRTCHVPTPETNGTTHYFIVHSRDFAPGDERVTRFMHDQLFQAFREDVDVLTRLDAVLAAPGAPFYEMSVASDAPSVAMRRYLRKRAAAEQPPTIASAANEPGGKPPLFSRPAIEGS